MQTNLLWTGLVHQSLEHCIVTAEDAGPEALSTIVGSHQGVAYTVDYHIKTNAGWQVLFADISCRLNDRTYALELKGDDGRWWINGGYAPQFEGCIDIDIPLTPFTNTLPIRRLGLAAGEEQEIEVLYLDLLEEQIRPVRQRYRRLSATRYHYENVPNDFEADIRIDESGFVIDYPSLFIRTAAIKCG